MKSKFSVVLILCAFALLIFPLGCSGNPTTVTQMATTTVNVPPVTLPQVTISVSPPTIAVTTFPVTGPPASGEVVIVIGGGYADAVALVPVGQKFKWINEDHQTHTVSRDDTENPWYFDYTLVPGASVEYTISTPGTYFYHCNLHPGESAALVVS